MIYIIAFVLSIVFIKLSMIISKKNKIIGRIFEVLGIVVPCLLAALRDYSIGTDVRVYGSPLFNSAKGYDSFIIFYKAMRGVTDILYILITYICAHITNNIGLLFFTIELLVILPIYIALKKRYKNKNENCIVLGMIFFYLFFYNQSYNIMRQAMAIAFIILGLAYLDEDKNKSFLICVIVACMFHNTAIIFAGIFVIYKILASKKINKKMKLMIEFLIIIAGIISVMYLPNIISIIQQLNIFSEAKAERYINQYANSALDVSYIQSAMYLYVLLIILIYRKKINENEKNSQYYIFSAYLSFIILQFGSVISYSDRIAYYIFYPLVITILPYIVCKDEGRKNICKNDLLILLSSLTIFISYWIIEICILKHQETYPYKLR